MAPDALWNMTAKATALVEQAGIGQTELMVRTFAQGVFKGLYNGIAKTVEAAGLKSPDLYFTKPTPEDIQRRMQRLSSSSSRIPACSACRWRHGSPPRRSAWKTRPRAASWT